MSTVISLTRPEAACLEALRSGIHRRTEIATQAGLTFRGVNRMLASLASLGLAAAGRSGKWHLTPLGEAAEVSAAPVIHKRGRPPSLPGTLGSGELRLLAALDRPRHGATLPDRLGVTKERVRQLISALAIRGLIRCADPDHPTFVVARADDGSILLNQDEERMLSALPEREATTLGKIARVMPRRAAVLTTIAESLLAAGLIEPTGTLSGNLMYRLTDAGMAHWQRARTARQAEVPPLPYRSDRVIAVLSHLASHGPTRTRDIGLALKIPQTSINALMQYLKRRSMVRTQTDLRFAPYELTAEGRSMLAALIARYAEPVELAA